MKYTRIYADSDGETHFEDVEVELAEGKVVPGGAPAQMSTPQPTTELFFSNYHSVFFNDFHQFSIFGIGKTRSAAASSHKNLRTLYLLC